MQNGLFCRAPCVGAAGCKFVGTGCLTAPVTAHEPRVPHVDLPRVNAAQFQFYDHTIGAFLVTEDTALARWVDELSSQAPVTVAADIETRGLDHQKFTITAATVAFRLGPDTVSLLFDPLRRHEHRKLLTRVFDHAERIIFHNATFDVAPLYAHRLLTREHIRKLGDTLVAARMLKTHDRGGRKLEELSTAYAAMSDDRTEMKDVFVARGCVKDNGFWFTDIDTPTYVVGALSDTVAALRLWGTPGVHGEGIVAAAARYLTRPDAGFGGLGVLDAAGAEKVVDDIQRVNQIVLERTARGYAVDKDFADNFREQERAATEEAARLLASAAVRPGNGKDLVNALVLRGEIDPALWKKTPTGQLKADKDSLKEISEMEVSTPLIKAHRQVFDTDKVLTYVTKVIENSGPTGRMHPEIQILGASATGRMSASKPEIQQFNGTSRGVILADDEDWISVDWKSIEPLVLAHASGDAGFVAGIRAKKDPYEPVAKVAGIEAKKAKQKMLAEMYGQGHAGAAVKYGWTLDRAREVSNTLRSMLPILYRLIDAIKEQSKTNGRVTTMTGRVLNQDITFNENGSRVTKILSSKAPNHFCQGSALDIMHHTILELDRRGLSEHVHLWMHDEVIADASVRAEVEEVMRTPPPFLQAVAEHYGFDPFLAVDTNVLGRQWATC